MTAALTGTRICLGIGRPSALTRIADLVDLLRSEGASVGILLPRLTGPLPTWPEVEFIRSHDAFGADHESTDHIALARWANAMMVLEADALLAGRLALGFAGDFLSLQTLAYQGPLAIELNIPASVRRHPAVVTNLALLEQRGVRLVDAATTRPPEALVAILRQLL
jgi:phosphopantothenoylcysteine decarboxylase/phosphopantothenate--cysteine ligase